MPGRTGPRLRRSCACPLAPVATARAFDRFSSKSRGIRRLHEPGTGTPPVRNQHVFRLHRSASPAGFKAPVGRTRCSQKGQAQLSGDLRFRSGNRTRFPQNSDPRQRPRRLIPNNADRTGATGGVHRHLRQPRQGPSEGVDGAEDYRPYEANDSALPPVAPYPAGSHSAKMSGLASGATTKCGSTTETEPAQGLRPPTPRIQLASSPMRARH
jgi:hypothetical protein